MSYEAASFLAETATGDEDDAADVFLTDALTACEYATVNLTTVNVTPLPATPAPPPPAVPLCRGDILSRSRPVAEPLFANNWSLPPSAALSIAHSNVPSGTVHRKCQPPKNLCVVREPPLGQAIQRPTCQIQNGAYALAGSRWAEEEKQPQQTLSIRVHEDDDKDFSVIEFPRENLRFLEKVGEGQFGEVRTTLCFSPLLIGHNSCHSTWMGGASSPSFHSPFSVFPTQCLLALLCPCLSLLTQWITGMA